MYKNPHNATFTVCSRLTNNDATEKFIYLDKGYFMNNLILTDIMLRRITSFIFAAQQNAEQAFKAWLAEEAKVTLGAVPYDNLNRKRQRSPEYLCDGLLADLSGKKQNVSNAMMQSDAWTRKLDRIFTQSGLTPMERTVMVRRYIDKVEDNQMISIIDGYTNVDTLFRTAIEKISHVIEKEAGMAL